MPDEPVVAPVGVHVQEDSEPTTTCGLPVTPTLSRFMGRMIGDGRVFVTGSADQTGGGWFYFSPWQMTTAGPISVSTTSLDITWAVNSNLATTQTASCLSQYQNLDEAGYLNQLQGAMQMGIQNALAIGDPMLPPSALADFSAPEFRPAAPSVMEGQVRERQRVANRALQHHLAAMTGQPVAPDPERVAASQRAIDLLRGCLSETQRIEFEQTKSFTVIGKSGRSFRLRWGKIANIDLMTKRNQVQACFCVHPSGDVPIGDVLLAQKFHLETDDEALMRIANQHPVRPVGLTAG